MSKDVLAPMASGMIGRFWPVVDGKLEMPAIHGAVRRDDEGYWQVDLEGRRTAQEGEGPDRGVPDTLIGMLGGATVFLSDKRRWQDFRLSSGQRVHVVRIRYETVVTGLDVTTVAADGILSAEAVFPDQMRWASYQVPDLRWREESEPLGAGWSLDMAKYPQTEHDIGSGMTLKVRASWRADWELDRLSMPFGLSLLLSATHPKPSVEFVTTLELFQDLISLCWGGRVPCIPGEGKVNEAQEEPGQFWSRRLLKDQPAGGADLGALPAVHLEDLGGPEAFGRWLELCRKYKRATRGVSEGLYVGASAEVRLLNTATATVYWVAKNRHIVDWADLKQDDKENDVRRLVMHQLPMFEDWVGDGERFSARFWWDYNSLKHNPTHEVDYRVVSVFTHSVRLMLIGSLLDRVADSTAPSERIAAHYWNLRDATKQLLAEGGRADVPEGGYKHRKKRRKANEPIEGADPNSDVL